MLGSATSGYVADLPVRLSKKFYPLPPQQNGFRDGIIDATLRYPAEALAVQYDFSAEKKALRDFQSNLDQYTASAPKIDPPPPPQSDIDSSLEIESSSPDSTSSSCSSIPANEEAPLGLTSAISYPSLSNFGPWRPINAALPSTRSFSSNGILEPIIAKAPAIASTNKQPDQTRPMLRLEEFENVPCNPFDMVELKSINDIEELRRLWIHPS